MSYISTNVDIDVCDILDELDDDDLLDELEQRALDMNTKFVDGDHMRSLLTSIWQKRRQGMNFDNELDQLVYFGLGKII